MRRLGITLAWTIAFLLALYIPTSWLFAKSDEKTLNVFTWAEMIAPEVLEAFEKEYGIKVKLHAFTTNEECMVKFNTNPGKYDLLGPSDYAIKILVDSGKLKKIDKRRLPFLNKMTHVVLNQSHDPNQDYCIPFEWEVYGLGVDRRAYPEKNFGRTLAAAFDVDNIDYKIAMTPDPFEAVIFAAHHLFGPVTSLSPDQVSQVRDLLHKQQSIVEAYVDYRTKYLFQSQNCSVALTRSTFIWQIAEEVPTLEFILPDEPPIISVENFAIPKTCKKTDLVYKFLNFIYAPENYSISLDRDLMFPVFRDTIDDLPSAPPAYRTTFDQVESRPQVHFFRHIIPEQEIRHLWITTKR